MKKNLLRGTALTAAALLALSLTACGPAGDEEDLPPHHTGVRLRRRRGPEHRPPADALPRQRRRFLPLPDGHDPGQRRPHRAHGLHRLRPGPGHRALRPAQLHPQRREAVPPGGASGAGRPGCCPAGEHIVTNTGDEDSYTLTLCKPDGTVEKTLCQTADNNVPTLADSSWLYCVVAPGGSIVRAPLTGATPNPSPVLTATTWTAAWAGSSSTPATAARSRPTAPPAPPCSTLPATLTPGPPAPCWM